MNEIALRLASKIFDQRVIENSYRSAFIEAMIDLPCATRMALYRRGMKCMGL